MWLAEMSIHILQRTPGGI